MPLTDLHRIARQKADPFLVQLWRALIPLRSVMSFMNTGAHPDDETSQMLASFSLNHGIDLSYACSTRGEGGQNIMGREAGAALGVLRTAEMEQAADILNMRLYWLSETPDDTIFDFGFSKSGIDTLRTWDHKRTLKRFVDILREERPDIICPTFLDVPGQHGHHRAMTQAAEEAIVLAADPAYTESSYPAWQVSKMYLPAWSGAGQSYDDDLPPPPATIEVSGLGRDPVTGATFFQLGEQSRAFHQSQGMGRWIPKGREHSWPLHLKVCHLPEGEASLEAGLPSTLKDLGDTPELANAQSEIEAALGAFPDASAILKHASAALSHLRAAAADISPAHSHRVARKESQLSTLIRVAAQVDCHGWLEKDTLEPTDQALISTEIDQGDAEQLDLSLHLPGHWEGDLTSVRTVNAPISDPYPSRYLPHQPDAPCLKLELTTHGVKSRTHIPFDIPPQVLPERSADLTPSSVVVNLSAPADKTSIRLGNVTPPDASKTLDTPEGWTANRTETGFDIATSGNLAKGLYHLPLLLEDIPAQSVQSITRADLPPRSLCQPAKVSIRVVDAGTTTARIGYAGGGNDRVDYWLEQLGLNVSQISQDDLETDAALSRFDTIVIGIFAMKSRSDVFEALPALHRWVSNGGTLLTLYHRPWDNWHPSSTPPAPLEIGQPSLRWRVTDEAAEVTVLDPTHPLLNEPNIIGADDWSGWHKERGLYFAKSWDPQYVPLLQMSDPDEAPHKGSLLSADIGRGRHVHCALILHHQMEKLVPGAFRLMVNLVTPKQ